MDKGRLRVVPVGNVVVDYLLPLPDQSLHLSPRIRGQLDELEQLFPTWRDASGGREDANVDLYVAQAAIGDQLLDDVVAVEKAIYSSHPLLKVAGLGELVCAYTQARSAFNWLHRLGDLGQLYGFSAVAAWGSGSSTREVVPYLNLRHHCYFGVKDIGAGWGSDFWYLVRFRRPEEFPPEVVQQTAEYLASLRQR